MHQKTCICNRCVDKVSARGIGRELTQIIIGLVEEQGRGICFRILL